MNYHEQYDAYLARAKRALEDACRRYLPAESQVCQAARYSLMGGGKRVRAVLVLSVCDMLGGDDAAAESFAAAVEMLHCYSLIHDDLPCMDDDDLRRGRPSCHKAFGEAAALLAGDVLLTEAFEAVTNAPAPPEVCLQAARALSQGAGSRGMVYGQELDLKYEVLDPTESQLMLIHHNKTGALINAAVQMGGAAAGATEAQREAAYRQVLLDLWFQCGAAGWLMDDVTASEVISATPSPANVAGEPEEGPASQPLDAEDGSLSDEALRRLQAASRMPIENLMDRVGGPLAEWLGFDWFLQWPAGLGPDTALWPPENSPDPVALAGGTMSEEDTHKLEQRLQQQYAEYGMELQVVTLSDSVLVLFSSNATLGFYYDPVLEVWSGFAVQ